MASARKATAARGALCVAALCGLVGGINHLTRDYVAALELQLEMDLGISEEEYHLLNVCFFAPNMILPLVFGYSAHMWGPARTQVGAAIMSAIGNVSFLIGVFSGRASRFGWLFAGRLLMGMAYEGLDAMWCSLVTPLVLPTEFATISSLINAAQRAGSATAFLVAPMLYSAVGLEHATILPSALGVAMVAPALRALQLVRAPHAAASSEDQEQEEAKPIAALAKPAARVDTRSTFFRLRGCRFGTRYWLFVLCATLLYASVVPFWFIGSKLLQRPPWSIPLHRADEVRPPPAHEASSRPRGLLPPTRPPPADGIGGDSETLR